MFEVSLVGVQMGVVKLPDITHVSGLEGRINVHRDRGEATGLGVLRKRSGAAAEFECVVHRGGCL
jgi:hypothetical protein